MWEVCGKEERDERNVFAYALSIRGNNFSWELSRCIAERAEGKVLESGGVKWEVYITTNRKFDMLLQC